MIMDGPPMVYAIRVVRDREDNPKMGWKPGTWLGFEWYADGEGYKFVAVVNAASATFFDSELEAAQRLMRDGTVDVEYEIVAFRAAGYAQRLTVRR